MRFDGIFFASVFYRINPNINPINIDTIISIINNIYINYFVHSDSLIFNTLLSNLKTIFGVGNTKYITNIDKNNVNNK